MNDAVLVRGRVVTFGEDGGAIGTLGGRRQIVFVTGELGIGKTALVEVFLERVAARDDCRMARAECIESEGSAEPYSVVLEALGPLCRGANGARCRTILEETAPATLAANPALVSRGRRRKARAVRPPLSPGRILSEMIAAIERIGRKLPLVLVLEDLHWADSSTLTLVAALAQRREPVPSCWS